MVLFFFRVFFHMTTGFKEASREIIWFGSSHFLCQASDRGEVLEYVVRLDASGSYIIST